MTAGRSRPETGAAGGPARHLPVMLREVVASLRPKDGGKYIDATFGAGGHSRALLSAANCEVLGFDRDPRTVAQSALSVSEFGGRLTVVEANFSELPEIAPRHGFERVDGILFDFGVSSMQFDEAGRGFSFRFDGPLDMRMSARGLSAADVVNTFSEKDLARIISLLGEEKKARFAAQAIVQKRAEKEISSTGELADILRAAIRTKPGDIDAATRTFQALRIYVNDELGEIGAGLHAAENLLNAGGRLAAISFHSLEDRLVKTFLNERAQPAKPSRHAPAAKEIAPSFTLVGRKPLVASEDEVKMNPRARSAKLRVAERTDAPAPEGDPIAALLAKLPSHYREER
ncbi:MAG: 16S rRNA (cytosine(1402)-N(4))-methyltransferase RsmH [Xanthobacteraceae bacterium]|nr:16S rRNA (cytosine(1402)-N(4))-methyltransferase RsmH [Xanthobacteraceae bacterium]QYK44307.1 MAG: 16S rRNA (cytosine(1402)-N(4))-methyltransferase RsmH [Xanthobacteraceae bacterium]